MADDELGKVVLRRPRVSDVPAMAAIINGYAVQGQMLPKSQHKLYMFLRDFVVVMAGDQVVGCGALHLVWEDLAEVRSLAVAPAWRGRGLGRMMIQQLLQDAREVGMSRVFALTYHKDLFAHLGFHEVPRESLPHKIWGDCLDCPKFTNCDETALMLDLGASTDQREELP